MLSLQTISWHHELRQLHTKLSKEFLNIIRSSKNLIVAFSTKNGLTKVLDIQNDTFDIEGFTEVFDMAQSLCIE
jgi:hypothetical protein